MGVYRNIAGGRLLSVYGPSVVNLITMHVWAVCRKLLVLGCCLCRKAAGVGMLPVQEAAGVGMLPAQEAAGVGMLLVQESCSVGMLPVQESCWCWDAACTWLGQC